MFELSCKDSYYIIEITMCCSKIKQKKDLARFILFVEDSQIDNGVIEFAGEDIQINHYIEIYTNWKISNETIDKFKKIYNWIYIQKNPTKYQYKDIFDNVLLIL